MEFFKPFLSKFSSSWSGGMARVVFLVFISSFEFWSGLGGMVKSPKLISSPPDRVLVG